MEIKKILVIDDSETNLLVIKAFLEDVPDFDVVLEVNSSEALNTINEYKPDLVILDLMMPVVDGFDILRDMKASSELKHISILVLSAKNDDKYIKLAKDFGADDYILKPLNMATIINAVEKLLY